MRIWSCLRALSGSAATKKPAVLIVLVPLLSIFLEAQERWKIQFFYDKQDSSFDIRDIQCPTAERCVAAGVIVLKDGHQKGAMVSTNDGGLHWSMVDVKENPLSLFFLNDSLGWMVTEHGIWTSDAGGWKKLESRKDIVRVYFLDPSHGYAIGFPGAMYETADGGKKWTKLPAANGPSADPRHTLYECITFRGPHGMAIGGISPDDAEPFLNINPSSIRQGPKSTVVLLETLDGGKSWTSRAVQFFGAIARASFTKEGSPVFLVEYPTYYSQASSVIQGPLGSDDQKTIFSEKTRAVTDLALLPDGSAVLATIEPPGNSNQIPIPGKLKMLESGDLKTWHEIDVDYRAVAQRAIVSAVDAHHKWVATDTGMILGLVGGGASHFERKQKTSLASRVLSTPSPQ